MNIIVEELESFYIEAGMSTYASGKEPEDMPERLGFKEFVFKKGDWDYRDSYTGFYRSFGTEVIKFKDKPVFIVQYGGGIEQEYEEIAKETYEFLKEALSKKTPIFSARGSSIFRKDEWFYKYDQEGDITNFNGFEKIFRNGELIFTHRVCGGLIVSK